MEMIKCGARQLGELCEIENESFPDPLSENTMRKLAESESVSIWAAKEEKIVGFIIYEKVLDEGQITSVAVKKEKRNAKIGERLLKFAVNEGKKEGIAFFTLEVREDNAPAIRLYEKCGFERVGLRRGYYDNPKCDAVLMTLKTED